MMKKSMFFAHFLNVFPTFLRTFAAEEDKKCFYYEKTYLLRTGIIICDYAICSDWNAFPIGA